MKKTEIFLNVMPEMTRNIHTQYILTKDLLRLLHVVLRNPRL